MAGDALSFAEVLRDEYRCLHDEFPSAVRATVEPKHLREVEYLEHKANTSSDPRYQLFRRKLAAVDRWMRRYGQTLSRNARAAKAFNQLLKDGELFEKLLSDTEAARALRSRKTLRRLLQVPHARAAVFHDALAADLVANESSLFDIFLAESPALRVLAHAEGGRAMLERYPALLATIADSEQLSHALLQHELASTYRATLIYTFAATPRGAWWQFWVHPERPNPPLVKASRDPKQVGLELGIQAACEKRLIERSIFNALLLETAFPDSFTDSYDVRAMNHAQHEKNVAALCLSGGGIRSATFNLGILQGLADHRLLTKFHYLSTVSGGGYIGSWLSSWMRRHTEGLPGVAEDLSAEPADPEEPEVRPIQHLREYSSYLAPRAAPFSPDAWTIVATYVRNLLLNWMMLIPALLAMLALPRVIESLAFAAWRDAGVGEAAKWTALVCGAIAVVAVAVLRPIDRKRSGHAAEDEEIRTKRTLNWFWLAPMIVSACAFCIFWAGTPKDGFDVNNTLPLLIGAGTALAGAIYVGRRIKEAGAITWRLAGRGAWEIAAAGMAGAVAGGLIEWTFTTWFSPVALGEAGTLNFEYFVCFAPALFLFIFFVETALLVGLTTGITSDDAREWWARSAALTLLNAFVYVAVTSAVVLLPLAIAQAPAIITSLGGVAAIVAWVLARAEMLKPRGEQETRSSAVKAHVLKVAASLTLVLIVGMLALLTTAMLRGNADANAIAAPPLLFDWNVSDIARDHLDSVRTTAPATLLQFIGAAAVVSFLMSWLLNVNIYSMHGMYRNRLIRAYLGASRWFRRPDPFTGFDPQDNVEMYELRAHALWSSDFVYLHGFSCQLVGLPWFQHLPGDVQERVHAFVAADPGSNSQELASELTDALNRLMVERDLANNLPAPRSVALFIKNREYLEKTFKTLIRPLGSHEEPHERPAAEPKFSTRSRHHQPVIFANSAVKMTDCTNRRRRPPLHIVNTTLNLVGGDKLAWQERQADSFTISPPHSGNRRLGYRDSYDYGEQISLGTAMAISGAAVSPNMGSKSSPAVTFLMTLFNARLGWWLGNPARAKHDRPGPTITLLSMLAEAFGKTNDSSDYVFLSDGGHFDNLGIYEMVRRRCRYIVACDATADSKYAFSDLGNAVRKIRVDTGIPITLSTAYLPPTEDQKFGLYCGLGLIHYGNVDCDLTNDPNDKRRFGYLLYIKPATYADCPPDVRNYKNEHGTFPHESTVDQFFSESQFESYRALGRHIVGQMCGDSLESRANIAGSVATFIGWSKNHIDERQKYADAQNQPYQLIVDWVQATMRA
jgi:hypothetical protein